MRPLMLICPETDKVVREAMGYRDGSRVCGNCRFFVGDDRSGSHDALRAHCERNAFGFEVEKHGTCDHFEPKIT